MCVECVRVISLRHAESTGRTGRNCVCTFCVVVPSFRRELRRKAFRHYVQRRRDPDLTHPSALRGFVFFVCVRSRNRRNVLYRRSDVGSHDR